jgi:isopentenyl-diphosphate Delta-isomerase
MTVAQELCEHVVLVDDADVEIGIVDRLTAHRGSGLLHRAFSVFVVSERGHLLVQRRAAGKLLFPGLLTNTCCSHPRPGETVLDAAHRRLQEEMGFDCQLRDAFRFTYRAPFSSEFAEWEYDHVLVGSYEGPVAADPGEVADWFWEPFDRLVADCARDPRRFTPWFQLAGPRVLVLFEGE